MNKFIICFFWGGGGLKYLNYWMNLENFYLLIIFWGWGKYAWIYFVYKIIQCAVFVFVFFFAWNILTTKIIFVVDILAKKQQKQLRCIYFIFYCLFVYIRGYKIILIKLFCFRGF